MSQVERIKSSVEALASKLPLANPPRVFAGADGFLDEIIRVVDKRIDAERYSPIQTISDYAARLAAAAGKSTNVEFVVEQVKSGGNGPLMCEALGRLGCTLDYVGCLGAPAIDPIFAHLQEFGTVTTIAPVAQTLATEFDDGKIMHGKHQSLKLVTWENLVAGLGGIDAVDRALSAADLVALVNWTMLPHLTGIFRGIRERAEKLGSAGPRFYFFDLCDPQKRLAEDLREALSVIGSFSALGAEVILGLNEAESLGVCATVGVEAGESDGAGLVERARRLVQKIGVTEVVIHPTRRAAAFATGAGAGFIEGPYCPSPKLTTGAGDHFNGGYMFARVAGLSPAEAVVIGKCVSGFYVREGRGPTPREVVSFANRWMGDTLDPWKGPE